MLEPGTKVKIKSTPHGGFAGLEGVVVEPPPEESAPGHQGWTTLVRINEHPDWEDWEPSSDNDYWFSEEELDVVGGAEAQGPSDDEARSTSVLLPGEGGSGTA
jgi:hypothetical protein